MLIDDLVRGPAFYRESNTVAREMGDYLAAAVRGYEFPIFNADNIFDYYNRYAADHLNAPPSSIGLIGAPPFPELWIEYGVGSNRVGGVVQTRRKDDGGWEVGLLFASRWTNGMVGFPFWPVSIYLNHDGEWDDHIWAESLPESDESRASLMAFATITLLTFTFLNCKNVIVTDNDGRHANRQERRAAERRGDPPLVTYKTLQIEPMKKVLATEGDIERNGLAKALHICRGHFAEYGPEFGKGKLFGKYEGRFYVPAHVRGNADQGVVHKRYNVKTPKEDAA